MRDGRLCCSLRLRGAAAADCPSCAAHHFPELSGSREGPFYPQALFEAGGQIADAGSGHIHGELGISQGMPVAKWDAEKSKMRRILQCDGFAVVWFVGVRLL